MSGAAGNKRAKSIQVQSGKTVAVAILQMPIASRFGKKAILC